MDKEEYINKSQDLLKEDTYRVIPDDPTNKQKNKLILLLKKIKNEGGICEEKIQEYVPYWCWHIKILWAPKSP